MRYRIIRSVRREGRHEILYDVTDDKGSLIVGNLIHALGEKPPTKEELDAAFNDVIYPMVVESQKPPAPPEEMAREEVKALLVDRGLITEQQEIEDLPTKQQVIDSAKIMRIG